MLKYVNSKTFKDEVLASQKPILVDFFATWCEPCKMLSPILESISNSRADFDIAKINIDEESGLAMEYDIEVVPTMLIFKNGKVVDKIQGYVDENSIVNKMSTYM